MMDGTTPTAAEAEDLYSILGVSRGDSDKKIKGVYRKLARKYHPDVNPGDRAAEEKFKTISAAFDVLSDSDKRARYDEFGMEGLHKGFDPEQARAYQQWQQRASATGAGQHGPDLGDMFGDFSGQGGAGFNLEDLLRDLAGASRTPRQQRGTDISAEMTVSLPEAVLGTQRELSLQRPVSGTTMPGGETTNLRVKVPVGIEDGQSIRLKGQGATDPYGGPTGDLLIRVRVVPHAVLHRDGPDLRFELPVTVGEAMLGAKVKVPTLQGDVTLTVPAGSQTGAKLRLRGKGVPAAGKRKAGDLYVVLSVRVPDPSGEPVAAEQAATSLDALYKEDVRADLRL